MITSVEVLQGGHNLESPSSSERVAAARGDNNGESVRHGVRVDEEWEYQLFCGGTPGCESVRSGKFFVQPPDVLGLLTITRLR